MSHAFDADNEARHLIMNFPVLIPDELKRASALETLDLMDAADKCEGEFVECVVHFETALHKANAQSGKLLNRKSLRA
jgi:hypothetical protein